MPILRVNADPHGAVHEGSPQRLRVPRLQDTQSAGPVVIMIHGFKYDPFCPRNSPHDTLFALQGRAGATGGVLWPKALGFGTGDAAEGLAIAFGWRARGTIWQAKRAACTAGRPLAHLIDQIKTDAPTRPVHLIVHSMGSEVAFEALTHLAAGSVDRLIVLTGASYLSRARAAHETPAGRTLAFFNVTSRENDIFDFAFERLIAPPQPKDRALGCGIDAVNAVNIALDCAQTLQALRPFGAAISESDRRICHWSGYTRPGAMAFYAHLMRQPAATPLAALKAALPTQTAKRWSRLGLRDRRFEPLPNMQTAAF